MMYAQIVLPIAHKNVDKPFTYAVPAALQAQLTLGMAVYVPFGAGNKIYEGYVTGFTDSCDYQAKTIQGLVTAQTFLTPAMIELALWMKDKYYTTFANCLKVILPPAVVKAKAKLAQFVTLTDLSRAKVLATGESKQAQVLQYLLTHGPTEQPKLLKAIGVSSSPIKTLQKQGLLAVSTQQVGRVPVNYHETTTQKILNEEQRQAVTTCLQTYDAGPTKPVLVHGVTGSGKTEVYMEIIEGILAQGKQAIVLVPEISLTPQTVARFKNRFGTAVSFTHSKLSQGERRDQWEACRKGELSILIGPRSAVFAPFPNLGTLIIDEEHEGSYKSETTPKYDALQVAQQRGKLEQALVVLGSATPSVDSFFKAEQGFYHYIALKKRVNDNPPAVHVVDMRAELKLGNTSIFGAELRAAIEQNLGTGMQTILFLNRRGHSTFVSCRACGHVCQCEACSVNYTYHRYSNQLMCHYCGVVENNPTNCPTCGSKFIKYFGIGTQRVEKDVAAIFPTARTLRMDLDTTSKKNAHQQILDTFRQGQADILIGTQMIAKGLDFPKVTLVGIIAADTGLNAGDYRSGELTYQLLTQVAGRAGRSEHPGRVYIQTYSPEHYAVIHAQASNYDGFYQQEIAHRRQLLYPPFAHVFVILATSDDEKALIQTLHQLVDIMAYYARKRPLFEILGPAPAMISKIQNKHRWKIIVKSETEENLKNFVLYTLAQLEKQHSTTHIQFNISLNPAVIL